jgi:hypothetical protein
MPTSREAEHSDLVRIDLPSRRLRAEEPNSALRILQRGAAIAVHPALPSRSSILLFAHGTRYVSSTHGLLVAVSHSQAFVPSRSIANTM